jgi:hypothetical protein
MQVNAVGVSTNPGAKLTNVKQISVSKAQGGTNTTVCATLKDGRATCWGFGGYSNLGTGLTTNISPYPNNYVLNSPTATDYLTGINNIQAGDHVSCAVMNGGSVKCWGYDNVTGLLAQGVAIGSPQPYPMTITALGSDVAQLAIGDTNVCAVKTDHTAVCYGNNAFGQIGNGTFSEATGLGTILWGGGGGTDFRLVDGDWDDESGLLTRVIVAGGGGGMANSGGGGYGGGEIGGDAGAGGSYAHSATGGSQTVGGIGGYYTAPDPRGNSNGNDGQFGIGASANFGMRNSSWQAGGGGGGWYGGGSGATGSSSAGGGSGYVLTASSVKPAGYDVGEKYYLSDTEMLAGNQPFDQPDGSLAVGKSGDGYARITGLINLLSVKIDGQECTNLRVISATEAKCTVPAHAAGKVDVTADFVAGVTSTLKLGYEYIAVVPTPPNTGVGAFRNSLGMTQRSENF